MLELRPAHDPEAAWGLVGVVVSPQDLSASVWRWHRDPQALRCGADAGDRHQPRPGRPAALRLLLGYGGTKQYDVSDPAEPRETGSVRLGGIVARAAHLALPSPLRLLAGLLPAFRLLVPADA